MNANETVILAQLGVLPNLEAVLTYYARGDPVSTTPIKIGFTMSLTEAEHPPRANPNGMF
jgi:hypothetical protein